MGTKLIAETVSTIERRGAGIGLTVVEWASAVLACGSCRYEDALIAAQRASEHADELAVSGWALVEVIEAASRLGKTDLAIDALRRFTEITRASGTDWALGIEARSKALVSDDTVAERFYREAIERLGRTRIRVELARSHLVYGEWLRRAGRRRNARDQLRAAHDIFTEVGAEAFGERARRELMATGLTVRKRTVETLTDLTAQEAQIARLAAELRTNPEIGAQLFLSPRTVEWHLHKVFAKLGVTSRRDLRVALGDGRSAIASA